MHSHFTLITGPMFSGKTTALLERAQAMKAQSVLMFKPSIDTRYSATDVVTHTGQQYPAIVVDREQPRFSVHLTSETTLICIDELNFFTANILTEIDNLKERGIAIVAAGLAYDFAKQPFGPAVLLESIADEIIRLQATCDGCAQSTAIHSYRKTGGSGQILVGANSAYGAACDVCWDLLQRKE